MSEPGTLRIGYLSARPWIYRGGAGLHGHDAQAAMRLAQSLKARAWFVECWAGDLATLLARGEIDLALGGLVDYGLEEVRCVPARHLIGAPAGSSRGRVLRQVFFPNTWWLCRDDRLWCWRVRAFLWAHRRHVRFGYRECSLQIGKTCILGALIPAPGRQRRACC